MIGIRVAFYVLYVVLGIVILVRLLSFGLRMETLAGIVLALALIALGVYRIGLVMRMGASKPR